MFACISRLKIKRLVQKGLVLGNNVSIQNDVLIDKRHCHLITIGNNVTLAPRVMILAHDASTKKVIGYTKIGNVVIGDNSFIGAGSIILPNVTIGCNVIIGAGSVVSKDIPNNSVAVGNPACVFMSYEEYQKKHLSNLEKTVKYGKNWAKKISIAEKKQMKKSLEQKVGYII